MLVRGAGGETRARTQIQDTVPGTLSAEVRMQEAAEARGLLYEGPYWSATTDVLWWVDIGKKQVLHRRLSTGTVASISMPEKVSAVTETAGRALLVTGERRLWILSPGQSGCACTPVAELSEEPPGNRCNDAKCDPHGNFWFGTMDDTETTRSGALWCLTTDGQLARYLDGIGVSNTLAWDVERGRMYFADSMRGTIYVMSYRVVNGRPQLGSPEIFAGPEIAPGVPDGSALDADGNLWNARWDGECVVGISPDGRVKRVIPLGAKRPTSCAFAGELRDTLVVTTASAGLDAEKLGADDGRVLLLRPGVTGQAVPAYGGRLLPGTDLHATANQVSP